MKVTRSNHYNIVSALLSCKGLVFASHCKVGTIFRLEVVFDCGALASGRPCAMVSVLPVLGIVVFVRSRLRFLDMSGRLREIRCMWEGMIIRVSYSKCAWSSPERCCYCKLPGLLQGSWTPLIR